MPCVPAINPTCPCPQVALFDRIHSIRVKAIQEEYQRYMERVRTKAQNAIDQANTQYQHSRTMLTARVDALVHYLQQRHLQVRGKPHTSPQIPENPYTLTRTNRMCINALVHYLQQRNLQVCCPVTHSCYNCTLE